MDFIPVYAGDYNFNSLEGLSAVYDSLPEAFNGICRAYFKDAYYSTCVVNKRGSNWGSIISIVNDDYAPALLTVNNGQKRVEYLTRESQLPKVPLYSLFANTSVHLRLSTYQTAGIIVCATGDDSYCEYIFSNGYFARVHETNRVTVNFDSSTYRDITFTNNSLDYKGYITCIFPSNVTIEKITNE